MCYGAILRHPLVSTNLRDERQNKMYKRKYPKGRSYLWNNGGGCPSCGSLEKDGFVMGDCGDYGQQIQPDHCEACAYVQTYQVDGDEYGLDLEEYTLLWELQIAPYSLFENDRRI